MTDVINRQDSQYLTFLDLTRVLLKYKWLIIASVLLFLVLAIAYGELRAKRYESVITLVYVEQDSGNAKLAGLAQQFGSIASFAGLGGISASTSRQEAVATLRSRVLVESYIADNKLLPVLFSARWDKDAETWLEEYHDEIPSLQDGYQKFMRRVMTVTEDLDTGLITVKVVWGNPERAAKWANELVQRVNKRLQDRSIGQANTQIEYLTKQLNEASHIELRNAIFNLIEGQIHSRMLASVNEDYALRIIDPAQPSDLDNFTGPSRVLLAIIGIFFGGMFGVFLVLFLIFLKHLRSMP